MATPLIASVRYNARRRRRIAQNLSAYAVLIETPEDLGNVAANADSATSFVLPADGRLAVSLDDVTVASDISLKDNDSGQVFGGGGVADFVQKLSVLRRGREIVVHRSLACPSGDCSIYILDEWQNPFLIATATFT